MAQAVNILEHAEDRKQLLAIVVDRHRPLKHVQRAKIILHSAERLITSAEPSTMATVTGFPSS